MEEIIIQDCGCIALPEAIAAALDLRRGMTLEVTLSAEGTAIILKPRAGDRTPAQDAGDASKCLILPALG